MGAADGEEAPVWFMERVCVTMKNGGAFGVVKEINDNIARVDCEDGTKSQLSSFGVIMVAPKGHDVVLVTGGADVGVEGELVCIDGTDAILKDSNEDFKIVDLVHLAKIVGDA
jgi:transcription elongation factor SPT5